MKPVIKWTGSKRTQADKIISFMPNDFDTYYEPFVGGGSVLYTLNPKKAICGDICGQLIDLWHEIQDNPNRVADEYDKMWHELQRKGKDYYYQIRAEFNQDSSPYKLLFLSRTCVNGLIRFNNDGEFNNAFHHTRKGINPDTLREIIHDWSAKISHVEFVKSDYRNLTVNATENDIVYLDPPYFHTKGIYYGKINYQQFLDYLSDLNSRNIRYLLSFDGVRGGEDMTVDLPENLYKRHLLLTSGESGFNRVMDHRKVKVLESLYLNF